MKKVYISGPMRGMDGHNRAKFNKWENKLRDIGDFDPVNPVRIGDSIAPPGAVDNDKDLLDKVLEADIAALQGCNAIFLLDGWERSEGAKRELACALDRGMELILQSDYDKYDAKRLADSIALFTNRFGVHIPLASVASMMTMEHPTLVQSFTSGFILQFVKEMAKRCRAGMFDGRDQMAVKVCEKMWTAVAEEFGLGEDEDIRLPMI